MKIVVESFTCLCLSTGKLQRHADAHSSTHNMILSERDLRLVAPDVGFSPENRQEVIRILQEDGE